MNLTFAEHASTDWLQGALLIAADEYPGLDLSAERRKFVELVPNGENRLTGLPPLQQAQAVSDLMYRRHRFAGNEDNYEDPRNSFINQVLLRRRGIPISLALVYTELARALGVDAVGVAFPGHFLVKVVDRQRVAGIDRSVLVDPFFGGAILDDTDVETIAERSTGDTYVDPTWLLPSPPKRSVQRMLSNLRSSYQHSKDSARLLVVLHRLLELEPQAPAVLRDRGVLQAQLGAPHAAISDLEGYLELLPRASDAQEVQVQIDSLLAKVHRVGPSVLLN